jgi:hypothetical protein
MSIYSQRPIELTTKDGRKVVLRSEGTWEFKDLPPQRRFRARKETGMYLLWGTLSLFSLVAGYYVEHQLNSHLGSHILNEIGIAGFVAMILAATIEYVSRKRDERRFKEEKEAIKSDVFEHVLGYKLPEGTFAELNEQILNASFIRKDFKVKYILSPLNDDDRFIKIQGQISYKVFNVTAGQKEFNFRTGIEKAPIVDFDNQVKFKVVKIRSDGRDLLDLQDEKTIKAAQDENTPRHLYIRKRFPIKGNQHVSTTIKFEVVRAREGGSEFFLTPLLALGFELFVDAWDGLEVSATAYLPEDLTDGDQHLKKQNSYHWVLERPILPFQGVYVSWKSKSTPPAQDTAPPSSPENARHLLRTMRPHHQLSTTRIRLKRSGTKLFSIWRANVWSS